jgi:hypothetical protein
MKSKFEIENRFGWNLVGVPYSKIKYSEIFYQKVSFIQSLEV